MDSMLRAVTEPYRSCSIGLELVRYETCLTNDGSIKV
jgi:hypothetical protein